MQWPIIPIKNLTSLFPLIFLSKHISLYALGRLKWILDIISPLKQHFNLKNLEKTSLNVKFLIGIICILLHWWKKVTLQNSLVVTHWLHFWMQVKKNNDAIVENQRLIQRKLRDQNRQNRFDKQLWQGKKTWIFHLKTKTKFWIGNSWNHMMVRS